MYAIKVPLKNAEKIKNLLIENNLLDFNRKIDRNKEFIFFPILDQKNKLLKKYEIIKHNLPKKEPKQNAKQKLFSLLNKDEITNLKTAFDIIGNIAIIEVDDNLIQKEKTIAQAILDTHKNIKTIVKKSGIHDGQFRTQKTIHLLGQKNKISLHKENNIILKVDVDNVYFSPRLATERKRIMQQIRKNEKILVMFSGIAPYPIVLSKNTNADSILGIELNPKAHKLALENLKLNKTKNIILINDDVNKIIPILNDKFDRILMPLPKTADDFLDSALKVSKKGTIIHFYDFLREDNFKEAYDKIDLACKNNYFEYKIISTNKCGQHAPYTFRICVDLILTKELTKQ
jgi:tRNA (guanine37-N1)-methyltransferase